MLRLLSPYAKPVRIWWYDLPDGTRAQHADARVLYQIVCRRNPDETWSYKDWYADMIDKICLSLPPGVCIGGDGGRQRVEVLTFKKVQDFIKAVSSVALSFARGETIYVSQAEADRRAYVCSECRYNSPVLCLGCHGFLALSLVYTRGLEVKLQKDLGACQVCGCLLNVTVWCTKEILERVDKDHLELFPDFCWRKELHAEVRGLKDEN